MAQVYECTLSLSDKPRFPKRCVVCGGERPDKKIGVGDFIISWFGFLTDIPEGWGQVKIPVHAICQWKFRIRRWLGRLFYLSLATWLFVHFESDIEQFLPLPLRRIGMKIVLMVMLAPVVYVEQMFFPPLFDITVYNEEISYEFRDAQYFLEFMRRNQENIR